MQDDQTELFVVVDESDAILSYRSRYDCHHDKTLIHRALGVVIVNDRGEVLLQKRSKYKDSDPGKYDVGVSGHVGKGETYETAAHREMKEEIGISTDITFINKKLMHFPHETEYDAFFKAIHNGPFVVNKNEIDYVEFVTKDEVQKRISSLTQFAQEALRSVGVL